MLLEIYNKDFKKVAYLENAFNIEEEQKINSINYLNFDIPLDDKKTEFLNPFWYVKTEKGLYRILPKVLESDEIDILSVECEHVIGTLFDDIMFGNIIIGNLGIYTEDVINYVLDKQKIKRWKLGECDFARQFEYLWEYENLASALFSIPKPLSNNYIWTFNTDKYPWTINLKEIKADSKPVTIISTSKNKLKLSKSSDAEQLFTRIYPLGYGEGVNQLNIKEVNNDIPYLQAPQHIIDKYGIIERVWIDRRYENAQSLKESAQKMLDEYSEPLKEYDIDYISIDEREKINLGDKIRIVDSEGDFDDIVVGIKYDHDDIEKSKITLANKSRSVATTIADLADRQRIEMTYSQGATQLYAQSIQANASTQHGTQLNFFIPQEMRIVNKVQAKIKIEPFRAYSKATKGGGGTTESTSSGGGSYTNSSTSSGGGSYSGTSTGGGGGTYRDTESDKDVRGGMQKILTKYRDNNGVVREDYGRWIDLYVVTSHSHGFRVPDHTHSVSISVPAHTHGFSFTINAHSHTITIPNHTHEIEPGIYLYGNPSRFEIRVNGVSRAYIYERNADVELTEYLLNNDKKINRGSWQNIEIVPNDLAYISIDLMLQGFVQSRGDYAV